MKKMIAIALSLCLMLTALCAVAESVDVINWEDVEPQVMEAGLLGEFVTLSEAAIKLWIPAGMSSQNDDGNGWLQDLGEGLYVGEVRTEDESAWMTVFCMPPLDGKKMEDEMHGLAEDNAEKPETFADVKWLTVNGLTALSFTSLLEDSCEIIVVTPNGYALELVFAPMSDKDFAAMVPFIMASIQAV